VFALPPKSRSEQASSRLWPGCSELSQRRSGAGPCPHSQPEQDISSTLRAEPRLVLTRYRDPMSSSRVPGGVVHKLPGDLRKALIANPTALDAWKDITPLARNEFICWVEDAKQETTRERRIRRTQEELEEGQRRPCCWPGCKHRERTGR
jgi:hypothetical protein